MYVCCMYIIYILLQFDRPWPCLWPPHSNAAGGLRQAVIDLRGQTLHFGGEVASLALEQSRVTVRHPARPAFDFAFYPAAIFF